MQMQKMGTEYEALENLTDRNFPNRIPECREQNKTHKLEMLNSNVSDGSNCTLITTWETL